MKKMLIGALTLSLAVAASAGALAEKYNLMFSHTLTENDPYHQAFEQWADAVSERTNGELTIDVYANAQLGAEEDVIEQMRMGANIGHNTDFARLGNYVPEVAVFNGPYMLESLDDVKKAQQLDCVKEWEKRLEEEFRYWQDRIPLRYDPRVCGLYEKDSSGRSFRHEDPHGGRADLAGIHPRDRRNAGFAGSFRNLFRGSDEGHRRH